MDRRYVLYGDSDRMFYVFTDVVLGDEAFRTLDSNYWGPVSTHPISWLEI